MRYTSCSVSAATTKGEPATKLLAKGVLLTSPDTIYSGMLQRWPTARPWLSVRMPSFAFEPGEAEAIESTFRDHDRIDPGSPACRQVS